MRARMCARSAPPKMMVLRKRARARVCVLTQRGRRIRVCPAATGLGPLRRRRDPGLVSRHRPRCARWRERRSLGAVPHRLVTDDRLALDSLGPPCLTSPTAWVGRSRAAACRATDDEPSDLSPWELAEMSRVPPSVLLPPTECMGAAGMRTFVPISIRAAADDGRRRGSSRDAPVRLSFHPRIRGGRAVGAA